MADLTALSGHPQEIYQAPTQSNCGRCTAIWMTDESFEVDAAVASREEDLRAPTAPAVAADRAELATGPLSSGSPTSTSGGSKTARWAARAAVAHAYGSGRAASSNAGASEVAATTKPPSENLDSHPTGNQDEQTRQIGDEGTDEEEEFLACARCNNAIVFYRDVIRETVL